MEFGEILSTVGGGSGIAAVLYVTIPKLVDVLKARGRQDAEGTALAAELIRERAGEHRECLEEVAELRGSIVACEKRHAESDARAAATEAVVAELRGVVAWMRSEIDTLRRELSRHTNSTPSPEPAE